MQITRISNIAQAPVDTPAECIHKMNGAELLDVTPNILTAMFITISVECNPVKSHYEITKLCEHNLCTFPFLQLAVPTA